MKEMILAVSVLLLSVSLSAQERTDSLANSEKQQRSEEVRGEEEPVKIRSYERLGKNRFGIRLGLNCAQLAFTEGTYSLETANRNGIYAGFSYERRLSARLPFYFETGLFCSNKGGSLSEDVFGEDVILKMNLFYLEVPAYVNYHFRIARGRASIQPFLGLYYGLGMSGNLRMSAGGEEIKMPLFKESSYEGNSVPQTFQRSDIGFGAGVAINFCSYFHAGLSCLQGLNNILKESDGVKANSFVIRLTVGCNF